MTPGTASTANSGSGIGQSLGPAKPGPLVPNPGEVNMKAREEML